MGLFGYVLVKKKIQLEKGSKDSKQKWSSSESLSNVFRYKQVILVRTDLEMSKGKIAVQVAHAAVTAAEEARRKQPEWWDGWVKEGQCKVTVKVDSEKRLFEIERDAKSLRLPTAMIQDRGLTEVPPGTTTCLGIGPAPKEPVDKVTGSLPLL